MSRFILYVISGLIGLLFIAPFIWILLTSLKSDQDIYGAVRILPQEWTLVQYIHIFQGSVNLGMYFMNSISITAVSVAAVVLLSSMSGYGFARFKFKGDVLFIGFLLLIMAVPWAVYLVPIYIMESKSGLINTKLGLILPYITLNLPLAILIMRGNYRGVSKEIEEAALMDGCTVFQTWYRIMLPIVKPGLATVFIFSAIQIWEEFMFARTLVSDNINWTLPVGITMLRSEAQSWAFGTLSAAIILSLIPLLTVFILAQQYFIRGITDGAIKG
ncbi:carbohydrate ABC transporter permease [Paenibacillus hamazuiensis]|uniref:carbohydrate ABC transporter permease n=1 Tax=Paenibacillus hamazuiensis TaxID=2936508 RepID=UPI0020107962|nr:carbohydrate ABC transporter permease [Paenibacillus hamazuiensis]